MATKNLEIASVLSYEKNWSCLMDICMVRLGKTVLMKAK